MELTELKKHWDSFAKIDPLWSILTDPTKKNNRWNLSEFFRTGVDEIAEVMRYVESLRPHSARTRALDFGCGVGRLTQALGHYFEECHGIDIAPAMIAQAGLHNRLGDRCRYHLNERDDLGIFGDNLFDFIYSARVLQHINPRYTLNYLAEFIRIVSHGGMIVFQLPGEPLSAEVLPKHRQSLCTQALPDSGFRFSLAVIDPLVGLEAGCPTIIRVRVKNEGDTLWPALASDRKGYQIRLGNHWLDPGGEVNILDDGRSALPCDLGPGEEVEVGLLITPPTTPGRYMLELDMVQEAVAWFKKKGAETVTIEVRVAPSRRTPRDVLPETENRACPEREILAPEISSPIMESHGIPKEQVIAFVKEHGGVVVDIQDVQLIGGALSDYRYCVSK